MVYLVEAAQWKPHCARVRINTESVVHLPRAVAVLVVCSRAQNQDRFMSERIGSQDADVSEDAEGFNSDVRGLQC